MVEDSEQLDPNDDASDDLSLDKLSEAFASAMGREGDAGRKSSASTQISAEAVEKSDSDQSAAETIAAEVAVSPLSILEAILFVGHPENEPMSARVIASLMRGVSPTEVSELVQQLNRRYEEDRAPYHLTCDGDGYRLGLREEFESVRDRFYGRIKRARLSQAAIDVLAIVAYQQPISRDAVSEMRGRPSGAVLTQLVRRQLLEVERVVQDKQRRMIYRTSERFLDLFALDSLDELPQSLDNPQ